MYCVTCPCRIQLVCAFWEGHGVHPNESEGGDRRAALAGAHDRVRVHVRVWAHFRVRVRAGNGYVGTSGMDLGFVQLSAEERYE